MSFQNVNRKSGSTLISNIGNFCYQTKPKFQIDQNVSEKYISPNIEIIERETDSPDSVVEIEYPENSLNVQNSIHIRSEQHSVTIQRLPQTNISIEPTMDEPYTISDSENENDSYDQLCDKERCLRKLLATCPMADIMEAQDILVKCNWDLDKAVESAISLPPKNKRSKNSNKTANKNTISSSIPCGDEILIESDNESTESLGITVAPIPDTYKPNWNLDNAVEQANSLPPKSKRSKNSNKTTMKNSISSSVPFEDEILIESDNESTESLGITVAPIPETYKPVSSSSNGITYESNEPTSTYEMNSKKRRRVQLLDEDEDSDSNTLSSTVHPQISNSGSNNNQNSGYSVLNFKPAAGKSYTYSKAAQENKKFQRIGDSSVFTDSAPNFIITSPPKPKRTPKPKSKPSKKQRRDFEADEDYEDEDYGDDLVYDSDDSDYGSKATTPAMNMTLTFFQNASVEELTTVPGCSKKKAETIISYRPFSSWNDLVGKLNAEKSLSTDLLNGAKKVLDTRAAVTKLMDKCKKLALEMEDLVEALKENRKDADGYVSQQPRLLNPSMTLTSYQMLGLNWLILTHNQVVNGILADEMGLGKTVQAIAFLAYLKELELKEQEQYSPHLIVVPSSTLDNWLNEFKVWWPSAKVLCYHGSQESRRELRYRIINDEIDEFDVMVSTYNMVISSSEDRAFFKRLEFYYVIFDEAHMLKNMASQRYQNLMRVRASRRLLLTGTPLQNNLVELMSLLIFAMPHMFSGKTEQIKLMFSAVSKKEENKTSFEKERIEHAKRIMKPFVLRRLKSEVLKDLPTKHEEIKFCPMSKFQEELYFQTVHNLQEEMKENKEREISNSGATMMMRLRRAANHPLLLRNYFSDETISEMAKILSGDSTYQETNADYIFEDMCIMSDFDIHQMCTKYTTIEKFALNDEHILDSGKFNILSELLPKYITEGHRVLLFSQFTMVLDIIESYMEIKGYKYVRLDGQIPVHERQDLINEFNESSDIFVFLLSTRAGGLGINLTSADTVIIHDIDFNPYNDKQAEDRCHRVGQTKDVTVIRFISKDTIEEGILKRAQEKLNLEKDVTSLDDNEETDSVSVAALLRDALGISNEKR